MSGNDKNENVSNSDDGIIVGESKPDKKQETSQKLKRKQTKHALAPGSWL